MTAKPPKWAEHQPIYRQLMEQLIGRILDQTYPEGEMLPSVRQLAGTYQINPLTVAKAFKELSNYELTEKKRGEGMAVRKGARDALLKRERTKFLKEEWPQIVARMQRMEIDIAALLKAADLD
jgi:GntR family transcriptional regulator